MEKKAKKTRRVPVCTECGLCCVLYHDQDVFCDVDAADIAQIPKRYKRHVRYMEPHEKLQLILEGYRNSEAALRTKTMRVRSGLLKGYDVCACVMLRGMPFKKVSCIIYPNRPKACRDAIKPGDKACRITRVALQRFLDK